MAGRPSKFTQKLADKICETIATTDKGLRKICEENNISTFSVLKWLNENKEFSTQYARAKEMQADLLVEQILEIADEKHSDTSINKDGIELTNHEVIARSRLKVDARKWVASKLLPKKYADKVDITTDGEKIQNIDTSKLSVEDLIALRSIKEKINDK